jgi:SAM-dependent methyltransferase
MPHFVIDWGLHALLKFTFDYETNTVLDIGSGLGEHKRFMEYFDKKVYSVDMTAKADYFGDFLNVKIDNQFDAIWCSHVLEHQRNVGAFLDKIYLALKLGGVLAIVVPTHSRDKLIPGHITSWSIPLLCYNLVLASFDCSQASILKTYELSLIMKKNDAPHFERGKNSIYGMEIAGYKKIKREEMNPFEHIESYFPFPAKPGSSVSGHGQINWGNFLRYFVRTNKEIPTFESKNINIYPDFLPKIDRH